MEIKKENIAQLIEDEKDDTYLNHLKTLISFNRRPSGEIRQNEILIWKNTFWNGIFYPIFKFCFDHKNTLSKITSRVNPIGKTIIGLLFIGFINVVISMISDPEISNNIPNLILIGVFAVVISIVLLVVYNIERRSQLKQMFEDLHIDLKPEKEWSFRKFISRLFLYPIALGLISLAVFAMIPEGEYLFAIILLAASITYLYSDIKILLKKSSNNK